MGFQKGMEGLAMPVCEEGAIKSTDQTSERKHPVVFHLRLPPAREEKWVNDGKAFREIQGKSDRPFKCDYQESDLEASGTEWCRVSCLSDTYHRDLHIDYNEYRVDISSDKK